MTPERAQRILAVTSVYMDTVGRVHRIERGAAREDPFAMREA